MHQDNSRWRISINGFDQALAQTVTFPTVDLKELKFGSPVGQTDIKIPGKKMVDTIVIGKLKPLETGTDTTFWDLLELASKGYTPLSVFFCEITLLGIDFITPVEIYSCGLSWVKTIKIDDAKRKADDQEILYESVTINPRDFLRIL